MHHTPSPSRTCLSFDKLTVYALSCAFCCALLSACGGGGGGGGGGTALNENTGAGGSTGLISSAAFPVGMAVGSPVSLLNSSQMVSGGLGVIDNNLNTTQTPQMAVLSSQVDAVATGRLDLSSSGLLSVGTLFDTTAPAHAACYGPTVSYTNHDDSPGSNGTLAQGDVAMWADDDSATSQACSVAELNAQTQGLTGRTQQAFLLTAAMRYMISTATPSPLPAPGATTDIKTTTSTLLGPLLSGITIQTATVALNADADEITYRLVLTQGSGAQAKSLEISLHHNLGGSGTATDYNGVMQTTLAYLSPDAQIGCSDEQASAGVYKVARLTSVGYSRQDQWLSSRLRSAQYCGHPTLSGSSHMAELATLSASGELDPTAFLTGNTHNATAWRQGFARLSQDMAISTMVNQFSYAWQDQAASSGSGHARLFSGFSELDVGTHARSLSVFHGYTDDISTTDGTMQGMICNLNGPGSTHTIQQLAQYQRLSLSSSANAWLRNDSRQRYAPTNSCSASSGMTVDGLSGSSHHLLTPTGLSTTIDEEILDMGFLPPVLRL
ncbi:MAG: hypothetical protein Q7U28_01680 [Aquabacterium sp.]|nr:hypothetical protein [Aquabacterium sp.]